MNSLDRLRAVISNRTILGKVAAAFADDGLQSNSHAKYQRSRDRLEIDPLLVRTKFPCHDGPDVEIVTLELALFIEYVVGSSAELQDLFARVEMTLGPPTPQRPWTLLLAFDEYIPGNQFRPDSGRKCMVCSFYVKELGPGLLPVNELWFSPMQVLSQKMKRIVGGFPRLLHWLVHRVENGPVNMRHVGAALKLRGRSFMLYASVDIQFSDNDGIRAGLDLRGAASLRPCFFCANIWKKGSVPTDGLMQDITCSDPSKFVNVTAAYLDEMIEALQAAKIFAAMAHSGPRTSKAAFTSQLKPHVNAHMFAWGWSRLQLSLRAEALVQSFSA